MRGERYLARALAGVLGCVLLLTSGRAGADERTEARGHFKRGMAAIADGHYDAGVAELKKAYEILPHPNVLYNIARAYLDTGDLENAIGYYGRYLEGNPTDRDEVVRLVASLEARLRRQQARLLETEQVQTSAPAPLASNEDGGIQPASGAAATAPGAPAPGPPANEGPTPAAPGPPASSPGPAANAPVSAAIGELKTEEVFEETVVTASKAAQNPLDAPSSTSIITEQDIRLSGVTKIPELLRRLAGVDVAETTGAQTEVSLRGFNQRLSNKVLVLVDGRSVYVDLVGATFWGTLSIGVEDIERIEVVRGPGSALYGADAFNGVINIITKEPGKEGSGVNVGYGERNAAHGSVWASGRDGDIGYRLSAGYDYLPRWTREVPAGRTDLHLATSDQDVSERAVRLDGIVTRRLGKDVLVGVQGGFSSASLEILSIGAEQDHLLDPIQSSDVTVFADTKHFAARAFWNRIAEVQQNNSAYLGQSLLRARGLIDVFDAELRLREQFETGRGIEHHLQLGAEYRLKGVEWTYLTRDEIEHHGGLFVHDDVKLGRNVALIGDYRADYVPHLDRIVQSARGSLLVHPNRRSTIRATIGTAFRTPTFLESYLDVPFQLPVTGGALLTQSAKSRVEPEQILSTELGYLNSQSDFFTIDTAVFYNRVSGLTDLAPSRPITLGDVNSQPVDTAQSPATGLYPLYVNGFENQCQAYRVYGAEVGLRTFPVEGLDLYANYTAMEIKQDDSGCNATQLTRVIDDARTSAHKVNAGIQVRTGVGWDGSVDVHYVSPQDWAEQVIDVARQQLVFQSFHIRGYTMLDARVGYRFLHNQAELSAVAFNLLDDEHREHPFGQVVGRRLMAFFTYKF